ncbi:MAG: hypothetical protein EVJ46_06275 [Candidatus Acididesulfobacter guangdongensis]|jgi:hypothetical protein|uniref:Uncharacterized protein n=1 Tax=Acididesulfobacter guangdongensis TaxID=2597225 RepID=A0A519BH75_ACIG2|nr:MAG: hypothetical protein EVJ46_06275 [Candidatus Acididesulfobacter guangdongensis]
MNKLCRFKVYLIAIFAGFIIACGVLAIDYYEFLNQPVAIINYEYQISLIMHKKDLKNKVIKYRLNLTKFYLKHKKNWLNVSKEMLLLCPIDKSLVLSKKVGVMAYKMVKYDKKIINVLKTIYGR